MATTLNVPVEGVNDLLATYDELEVYHDTSPGGTFSSEVSGSPVTLEEDVTSYEVSDSTGVPGRWYRSRLTGPGPVTTELSPPWQARGLSLRTARLEAAIFAGRGAYGTCSTLGTVTTLVDEVLSDQGQDTKFAEGAWIFRPDAEEEGDYVRRVALDGFTVADGTLTVVRPWTNEPEADEAYELYTLLPPIDQPGVSYSWARAVRDALMDIYYIDQLVLGPGTDTRDVEFSLSPFLFGLRREDVRYVYLRTFDSNGIPRDTDASKQMRFWDFISNGDDDQRIRLSLAPRTTELVVAEVNRVYDAIYRESDITSCNVDLLAPKAVEKVYQHLNRVSGGRYMSEWAMARAEFTARYNGQEPDLSVKG